MWLTYQLSEISSISWGSVLKAFGVVILLCLARLTEILGNKIAVVCAIIALMRPAFEQKQ
jgi:hypothetical protein